jgi:lipase chaperone LimK
MIRTIIAGTAVAGALTLGLAGVAGAATPTSSTGNTGSNLAARCAKLPQLQSKVQTMENKVNNTVIPKLQARENTDKTNGNTAAADRVAQRIQRLQNREARWNTRLQKAQAKCSSVSGGTSTAS